MDDLITVNETAALARTSPSTVRWWISNGTECGSLFGKVGRKRLARRADIEAWLEGNLPGGAR